MDPDHLVTPHRLADLLGDFDRAPAWAGLAEALRLLVAEGRLAPRTRLPSERDLAAVLPVSRTTVTRAYDQLRTSGWARARVGAGTWTDLPGGRRRALDRVLTPRGTMLTPSGADHLDLTCAAAPAPPGVLGAFHRAVEDLPSHLGDHGYFPAGLPELTEQIAADFTARGLPTVAEQVMVTPGALAATSVVAHALLRAGDRVLVETPVYPNAPQAFVRAGARLVTQPIETRDVATTRRAAAAAKAAYLVPDFQNPTGLVLDEEERGRLARAFGDCLVVVDESHQLLSLEGQGMPSPMAAHVAAAGGTAVTVGGAAKAFWGGLRLGRLRAPEHLVDDLTRARLALDLGTPVVEQLALTHLLRDPDPVLSAQRERLRRQRDTLVTALRTHLPDWEFDVPSGGLALWCRLPLPRASALAEAAEAHGVTVTAGQVFDPDGGHARRVRIPWALDEAHLTEAVRRLATAWQEVKDPARRPGARAGGPDVPVVA